MLGRMAKRLSMNRCRLRGRVQEHDVFVSGNEKLKVDDYGISIPIASYERSWSRSLLQCDIFDFDFIRTIK
jgi:hypothetical protein